jgi:hypothetical protein
MEAIPVSPAAAKTNIYALLSPINGGLAFLSNCISLFSAIFPPLTYICAAVSGLLGLGALLTGVVGMMQVNRQGSLQKGKGLAVTGIVLGVLAILAACLIPLLSTVVMGYLGLELGDQLLVPIK